MQYLWAPWRMVYIKNCIDKKSKGCIFCTKPKQKKDKENLILYRGNKAFVMCNAFPYNNGHLMVIPYKHTSKIDELDKECLLEIWELVSLCCSVLKKYFSPDGFNIGINLGRTAGAGIDNHVHIHIVPRWNGDTNFMPVIGKTKVISQSLTDTYESLIKGFNRKVIRTKIK
jgi:ATP adenylyltransferase